MGFFDRLHALADPTGIRRATRETLRSPTGALRVERLQEQALLASLNYGHLWNTTEAPKWRTAGWPGDTLGRYGRMQQAWFDTVGRLLYAADYDPDSDIFAGAAAWVAAEQLARTTVPGAQQGRLVLAAFVEYGHPYPCEDAGISWCQGWCTSDWRRWTWRWNDQTDVYVPDSKEAALGATISRPPWL